MRVALPTWHNLGLGPSRLADHVAAVRAAAQDGADLVVFPELSLCGYPHVEGADWTSGADAEDARAALAAVAELSALAVETGCAIVVGVAEAAGGEVYDSVVLLDAAGGIHVYRKVHLTPAERALFAAGDEAVVVSAAIGGERLLVGLSSCYDKQFPALYQRQRERGAEVSIVASAWSLSADGVLAAQSQLFDRARAAETGMVVVSTNYAGPKLPGSAASFCGGARVVDPLGREQAAPDGLWTIDIPAARAELLAEAAGDFFARDRVAAIDAL